MPWNKNGDTGGTHPAIMAVAGLRGYQPGDINMVAGFYWRLTNQSSAFTTDYIVDAGTVVTFTENNPRLLKLAIRTGLLTKCKGENGLAAYRLLEDPEFVHIRTKAEIQLSRQQKADTNNLRLAVPVRFRDGDLCRYCQVVTAWAGRMSPRRGTLDHLHPGEEATVDTMVVACTHCNSQMRDMAGEERETLLPAPDVPFYTQTTAKWLTKNGRPVEPSGNTNQRPDTQPGHAQPETTETRAQRPSTQPGHARIAASDPTKPGPRAGTTQPRTHANRSPNSNSNSETHREGMHSAGSGRDGSGNSVLSSTPVTSSKRRRKRSRRSRGAPE
ncbi:hypothetical protein ACSMXN_09335 [Jatrophihabitans sp. DSM 45814]